MTWLTSLRACLVLSLGLPGCGPTTGSTDTTDGTSTGESSTGEPSTGESSTGEPTTGEPTTGSTPSEWPRRVTLVTNHSEEGTPALKLAEGTLLAEGGDIHLALAYVLSLRGSPDSVCEKGTFDALGDVPTDLDTCPAASSGTWGPSAYLDASWLHTQEESNVIGLGLLVWDEAHTTVYRLRVLGDSYDEQGQATVTFDYEPVPPSP